MKPFSLLLRLFLGLAFLCGGFWTLKQHEDASAQEHAAKQWRSVDATITQRETKELPANARPKEKQPSSAQKSVYQLKIGYRYTFEGKELLGSLTTPSKHTSAEKADSLYPTLQVGETLTLKVNPFLPTQSLPQNIDRPSKVSVYTTASALLLVGLFLTIHTFIRMRK